MTKAQLIIAIKNKCGISGTAYDTYLLQEINDAQKDFTRELNLPYLETKGSVAVTQYQYVYDLASDFDTMQGVIYQMDTQLVPVNYQQWLYLNKYESHADPKYYIVHEGKLKVYPTPNAAAPTTTLNGAISSTTTTTITLASVSSLKDKGRGIVDSEVIEWQYVDGTNIQIKNCRRGVESTTAATHLTGATFTYRELEYTYWKTLADLSADADESSVPVRYHDALYLRPSASFLRDHAGELGKADRLMIQYEDIKKQAMADLGEKIAERFSTTLEDTLPRWGYGKDEFWPDNSSLTSP